MITPTQEQELIILSIKTNNICVNAVAGAGKTTCILMIAQRYPNYKILCITYNKKLKIETRERATSMGITNIEVHSYHSCCRKYYDQTTSTDYEMIKVVNSELLPLHTLNFNIIVLDECQDMTGLYYKFSKKLISHNMIETPLEFDSEFKLLMLGDFRQAIYNYKGSDPRYLTLASKLFEKEFLELKLTQTNRCHSRITDFVNNAMLDSQVLIPANTCPTDYQKVFYYTINVYNSHVYPLHFIKKYISRYSINDIAVLGYSLKDERSPIKTLATSLSNSGYPVFISLGGERDEMDEEMCKNKVLFLTFHQSKGITRKVIFLYDFYNISYDFRYKGTIGCPNLLYVAATRASEVVVIFQHFTSSILPFINPDKLKQYTQYYEYIKPKESGIQKKQIELEYDVTSLISHIDSVIIDDLVNILTISKIVKPSAKINITSRIRSEKTVDDVSDINGILIPTYYEYKIKQIQQIDNELGPEPISIIRQLEQNIASENIPDSSEDYVKLVIPVNIRPKLLEIIHEYYSTGDISVQDLIQLCIVWSASVNKCSYKINQIKTYDWIDSDVLNTLYRRMKFRIKDPVDFEYGFCQLISNTKITGIADIIDSKNRIWEIKCTKSEDPIHFIQLAVYMYMNLQLTDRSTPECTGYLYYVLTDTVYSVTCTKDQLLKLVEKLIQLKTKGVPSLSDEEFLQSAIGSEMWCTDRDSVELECTDRDSVELECKKV